MGNKGFAVCHDSCGLGSPKREGNGFAFPAGARSRAAAPLPLGTAATQATAPPAAPGPRAHTVVDSPVGPLTLAADGDHLVGLWMARHRRPTGFDLGHADPGPFRAVATQLEEYFAGERTAFDVPLAPAGPDFARRVWALLCAIPYGETRTYGDLARELGRPGAAQAVGAANGANPVSIVVPCHRVVGADGALIGYAGGLDAKRALLALEASRPDATRLF